MPEIQYAQFQSVVESLTRITEASDTRITESGDIRQTETTNSVNTVIGSIVADPTYIKLVTHPYLKVNGVWKAMIPYVKHNEAWNEPQAIYKKESGHWRRIY